MKLLAVPYLPLNKCEQVILPSHPIDVEPWRDSSQKSCHAEFTICHFDQGLRVHYRVMEPHLSVKKRKINGSVHKDNCVEFFLAFEKDPGYYNFEFNCLGSVKAAYGNERRNRTYLPPELLTIVQNNLSISLSNTHDRQMIAWEITIILPISVFCFHDKNSFSGLHCSANFSKCGDNLPSPHFLSWVDITSDKPDFHQPQSFGKVTFENAHTFVASNNVP
jgi:hypothetical protein